MNRGPTIAPSERRVRRETAVQAMQIRGMRVHVERSGSGPPLVLLHGLGDDSERWLPVVATLAPHFTLIRYDLPGHGLSGGQPPRERSSLAALVDDLGDLLDHLDLAATHLAGHDLGGAIAQRLAYERPERVRTLVLEGTLPAPLDRPRPSLKHDRGHNRADGVEPTRAATGGAVAEAAAGSDGGARLAAIACPTLVLVGEEDSWPFQQGADLLHGWIPNSRLVRVPDAGHTPHADQPEAFAEHVRTFLTEHEARR